MKTTLIQIDPHDDLTSIKDKMTWSKSARMLLFFPSGYPLFQTDLALRLIQRYSITLGSQLAIVTRDNVLRNIAIDLGISCFVSAPQAEKSLWKVRDTQNFVRIPKGAEAIQEQKSTLPGIGVKSLPTNIQKMFTSVLLVLLLIVIVLFFIPSAQIILYPVSETQEITYNVTAGTDFLSVDIAGKLPAAKLSQEISASLTKNSTGTIVLPISKASGSVEVINLSSQEIFIPAGSMLTSDSEPQWLYILVNEVNLKYDNSEPLRVKIEANDAGADGNVPPGMTFVIEGYENLIQIQNPSAISGGNSQFLPSPGEADYLNLHNELMKQLLERCEEKMESQAQSGQSVIPGSIILGAETLMVETPPAGQPSDIASLSITIECTALFINENDELELAKRILDQNLLTGMAPLDEDISITREDKVKVEGDNRFSWTVNVSRRISQIWNVEELIGSLLGKGTRDAKQILAAGPPQSKPALITINPRWWKHLPLLPTRVHIEVSGK
jgi:hypothetical protein